MNCKQQLGDGSGKHSEISVMWCRSALSPGWKKWFILIYYKAVS